MVSEGLKISWDYDLVKVDSLILSRGCDQGYKGGNVLTDDMKETTLRGRSSKF